MNTFHKFRYVLLFILVLFAPFHALLSTWLQSTLFSGWREIVVVLMGGSYFLELLIWGKKPRLDGIDVLILFYAFLAFFWLPFQKNSWQWLLGFRFDVFPFLIYFIAKRDPWPEQEFLKKAALASAGVVLVFGILHALILPKDFLTYFGYSTYPGEYRTDIPIAACQYLEHTTAVCRATSTFGGPTRYGTYLLLMMGLALPFFFQERFRKFAVAFLGLALVSIVLTYSRSVWIGVVVAGLVGFFLFERRQRPRKLFLGTIGIFLATVTVWVLSSPFLKTVFIRATSTGEHAKLLTEGIYAALANPLGIGLGTVGPASVHFEKFLTENWYLQIAIEMGVLGLLLFFGILIALSKKLLRDRSNVGRIGLFLALLGIAVTGLFTHSFEETTTVMLLFAFAGIIK